MEKLTDAQAELLLDMARRHVLSVVCWWPGWTTPEIAAAAGYGEADVAELLAELERTGLVTRDGYRWQIRRAA